MKKFRTGESRDQLSMLPPSIDDYVPAGDTVRYVDSLVEELNLGEIEASYSVLGRPGYSPRMLVKVLMYGKIRGVRSGRELSRACTENLKFIYLARNEKPDFRTINEFRKTHSKRLASLLRQTIQMGLRDGVIDLKEVCIDGTKLGASAGRRSFKHPKQLQEQFDALEQEIHDSIQADIAADDEQESKREDDSDDEPKLSPELRNKAALKERVKQAIREYEESTRTEKPKTLSTTDPECRMMKGKGVNPSYNMQAAVDAKSRMVVAGYAVNACCDSSELIRLAEEIKDNTQKYPSMIAADKGYTRLSHLVELEKRQINGFISLRKRRKETFKYDENRDVYICPEGRELVKIYQADTEKRYARTNCDGCLRKITCWRKNASSRQLSVQLHEAAALRMERKLQTEEGKAKSVLRSSTIEPLFGILKFARKLRQLSVRGLQRVSEEWQFELAAHNLDRLCRMNMSAA